MTIIIGRMKGEVRTLRSVDITVYLDMFFLVNILMDLLLLNLVKHLMTLTGGSGRIAAAAAVGAVCSCLLLLIRFEMLSLPRMIGTGIKLLWMAAGDVGVPALMMLTAFGRAPLPLFIRRMAVFWMISAGMGGILSLADQPGLSGWCLTEVEAVRQWRLLPLILWAAGTYLILRLVGERIRRWRQEREFFCRVTLFYRGHCQTVTALWDTGNHLYEPYGHQPVHVITDEACLRLCDTVSHVAYIPFQAVGTGYGLLPGIRIDSMDVVREGKPAAHYERPWLAVSKGPLSTDRSYEMLLHGEKLE